MAVARHIYKSAGFVEIGISREWNTNHISIISNIYGEERI